MPIVFDNIIFSQQRSGGVSRVWSKIIQPYIGDNRCRFIENADCENNLYRRDMPIASVARVHDHYLPRKIAQYLNFSRDFFDGAFVFHSSYFRVNKAPGCKNVTTVHDMIYEKMRSGIGSALHLHQKVEALQMSDAVVCVSEHTRKDLLEHYPFCTDKRVVVIPNGVEGFRKLESNLELLDQFGIKKPKSYFLYVGHRQGTAKGFDLVYDAIDMLGRELQCVVVGNPFTKSELAIIRQRGHEKRILNVGKVSDSELNHLYSQARFFFFPSFYEGFGIPPLEAMSAGCPVLASNRSSVPEVVGDAGVLFDPSDLGSLESGLSRVLQNEIRGNLIALGIERATNFSWKPVVERYAALYSELH